MPKIDISSVPERRGTGYPAPFDAHSVDRIRQRLANKRHEVRALEALERGVAKLVAEAEASL